MPKTGSEIVSAYSPSYDVEGGQDSGAFHNVTSVIADLSLLPFALALGIDVFVSGDKWHRRIRRLRRPEPFQRQRPSDA
jgi:hypothetical protein